MKKFTLSLIAMIAAVFGMNAELYIVGNMNDWKFQQMTETSENVYTWTGDFSQGDDFKFPTIDGEWYLRYTCTGTSNELVNKNTSYAVEYREGGNDDKLVMAETGNYTVTVNLNDNTMICHLNEDVVVYPDLYIVGDGTPASWNPSPNEKAAKMKKEGRTYSKIIYLASDTRFVFLAEYGKYWPRFLSDTAGTSKFEGTEVGEEYGIRKYPIDENDTVNRDGAGFGLKHAGVYEVNVTLSEDGETGTMTLQYAPLTVVGPATEGWDLGKAPSMEIVDDGNYTYTGQVNAEEFRINAKGDWWPSFVMNNASDGNTPVAVTGGTYDLQWSAGEPPSMKFAAPGYSTL